MRTLLTIKSLYRSPVKSLLTFILLIVVTFAFFSQTAEYAVTAREFNNAAKQYCGVGSAEVAPPLTDGSFSAYPFYIGADPRLAQLNTVDKVRYRPLTREQINAISALPYVSSADMRYMTAGISDTFYRLDDGEYYYNYTARCVIEGTLTEVHYGDPAANIVDFSSNRLILGDCTILAGNPPRAVNNEKLTILATPLEFQ
ncbi:MAG: hypothetical protein GX847_11525, partial [Clostridiales bacterium]|nr:hypothetical protein [Clostridiales bacterium]